jgi:hypothetical protein
LGFDVRFGLQSTVQEDAMPPFALVLRLALAEAMPSTAPDPLAATLERQTQALFDALTRGDKANWDKLLAPDLVYVSEDGTIKNKAQLLEEVRSRRGSQGR